MDGDGDIDWVGHFRVQDTNIKSGDTEASLTGKTTSGLNIMGTDSILIVPEKKPPLSVGRIVGQFLAGIGGEVVGAVGGVALGSLFPQPSGDNEAGPMFLGFIVGGILGGSMGVYLLGTSNTHGGSYWATLGGDILFASTYILYEVLFGIPENSALEITGHLILPVTGAVIGFNLTRRYKSPPASGNALINFRDGQMRLTIPTISFRPDPYDRGTLTQRVDLVKVRF